MSKKNNPYLKRANEENEYTLEHIRELKKCMEDPVYFAKNYCKIQHPVRGAIKFHLYPYQENMLQAYAEHRNIVVLSARQTGKAIALDTVIPTPTGWTTMGDINVGDEVLGADGLPTKVTFVSDVMFDRPCYNVKFSTGESIIADIEHLWEVVDEYTQKCKVLTTGDMVSVPHIVNAKNQARFTVKTTNPIQLPYIELPVDPYVLGAWLGDGTTTAPSITNHNNDSEIIDNVKHLYQCTYQHSNKKTPDTTTYYFKKLRTDLKSIGVLGNKHIPINYLRSSYQQRLSLLQGLMDTDGYVNPKTGGCELTLTCKKLVDDVSHLISTLGLKNTVTCRKINGKYPHVRWTIWFTPFKSEQPVFRLTRKLNNMKVTPSSSRVRSTKKRSIQSITPVDSVPVRCITVDNTDSLFLVGPSMIPTHNSVTSAMFLLWYATFHSDKTVLIASNKNDNAMEMIIRIKYAYEHLPHWLKAGITDDGYNKHAIGFDNGSRIVSTATSENSGRGMSISCVDGNTLITVRNKQTGEVLNISIEEFSNMIRS